MLRGGEVCIFNAFCAPPSNANHPQTALAAFSRTTARARNLLKFHRPQLPSSSSSPHHLHPSPQKSLVCLPREGDKMKEEEERRRERWRELSKSLINLRVAPSKEKTWKQSEEEDDMWKGVWRKGGEPDRSVWGSQRGGQESSLWRSRENQKSQVSFISLQ